MGYKNHILTGNSIMVIMDDGIYPVAKNHPNFDKVKECLRSHTHEDLPMLINKASIIVAKSNGAFKVKNGRVMHKGKPLPNCLSERVYQILQEKLPLSSFVKFWDNLSRNPSIKSRNMLYQFLEKHQAPITEDGYFILYKRLNKDYTDCHTGTVDNHPGKIIKMPRKSVDSNEYLNCSNGFHVAAYRYAKGFGSGKFVEVRVNPKNVVSVPNDSNCEKIRVCEYEVLHEVGEEETPAQELVYNYHTYYYKGNRNKMFAERLVTGKKPSRFIKTCRAKNVGEACDILRKTYAESN